MTKAAELAKIISASGVVSGVGFTAGNAVLAEAELELLDGLTAGTAIASKVITTDANIDSTGMRNLTISGELDAATLDISGNVDIDGTLETDAFSIASTAVTSTAAELNILDGVTASATDINLIDGITNGTVIASKAIITDSNKDITGGRNITISGELDAATLDISGDIDVDGTTNLDVVDIDGAVDMASTLAVAGVVTANAGITVDNITIDGTEIDLSSGDLTLDVAGDIILDADGGDIKLKDGSTIFGELTNNASADGNFDIKCPVSDADIRFKGNDGGATITALRLDMSSAGSATFNHDIKLPDNGIAYFGAGFDLAISSDGTNGTIAAPNGDLTIDVAGDITLDADGGDFIFKMVEVEMKLIK